MSKIHAHRGFSAVYPENTLLAFTKALEFPIDAIEIDVQRTKDNHLIVMHDEKIDRTTTGKGYVRDLTLAEIEQYDASSTFRGQFGFVKVPTLREYFELLQPTKVVSNIELKNSNFDYPDLEKSVLDLAAEYGLTDRIMFSSFNHYSMIRSKKLNPAVPCGLLYDCWLVDVIEYAKKTPAECLHPKYTSLNADLVKACKKEGIQINTWTVNEEKDIRKMLEWDVDGIISNFPDLCCKLMGRI